MVNSLWMYCFIICQYFAIRRGAKSTVLDASDCVCLLYERERERTSEVYCSAILCTVCIAHKRAMHLMVCKLDQVLAVSVTNPYTCGGGMFAEAQKTNGWSPHRANPKVWTKPPRPIQRAEWSHPGPNPKGRMKPPGPESKEQESRSREIPQRFSPPPHNPSSKFYFFFIFFFGDVPRTMIRWRERERAREETRASEREKERGVMKIQNPKIRP